jgi:hypothetical protein
MGEEMIEMAVLVTYASKHGVTQEIAERIAQTLRAAGQQAQVRPVSAAGDLAGYGALVIGSAVYMGHWQKEAMEFVRRNVLMAPTFLLQPAVDWAEVNDNTFDVTLTDAGRSVTGRVFLNERGAPVYFSTTDRFAAGPRRAPRRVAHPGTGVDRPGRAGLARPLSCVWHLPEGELPTSRADSTQLTLPATSRPAAHEPAPTLMAPAEPPSQPH